MFLNLYTSILVNTQSEQQEKVLITFLDSMKFDYQSGVDVDITVDFLDQYNKEIDEAGAEIDAGNYLTQNEVEKFFAGRRKKPNGD